MQNATSSQTPLSRDKALEIAVKKVADLPRSNECIIVEEDTIEKPFGWVFFYTTKKFVETKDKKFIRPGNGPIVVERSNGKVTHLPSSIPPKRAIEEFERRWKSDAKKH